MDWMILKACLYYETRENIWIKAILINSLDCELLFEFSRVKKFGPGAEKFGFLNFATCLLNIIEYTYVSTYQT